MRVLITLAISITAALSILAWLFGGIGVLIAVILMASGIFTAFAFLNERLERIEKKLDALAAQTEETEQELSQE